MLAASLRPVHRKSPAKKPTTVKSSPSKKMGQIVLLQPKKLWSAKNVSTNCFVPTGKNTCQRKGLKIYFVPVKTFVFCPAISVYKAHVICAAKS